MNLYAILTKNAKINTDERLTVLLAELSLIEWDIICFTETRSLAEDRFLTGSHRLICSYDTLIGNQASGVVILVHQQHCSDIPKVLTISDRNMAVDIKMGNRITRIISAYILYSGYPFERFQEIIDQLRAVLSEARLSDYRIVLTGDFNTQTGIGRRWTIISDLCDEFDLNIVNQRRTQNHPDEWTYRTSDGDLIRIDFIMHSKNRSCSSHIADRRLDLRSDHRALSCILNIERYERFWRKRKSQMKGWRPRRDEKDLPVEYHQHMDRLMRECRPDSLQDLNKCCIEAAQLSGSTDKGSGGLKRPDQSRELKDLIRQRRECVDSNSRRELSKKISKLTRKESRAWKSKWSEYLLGQFRNTKYLQRIKDMPRQSSTCPIESDVFRNFLEKLYDSPDVPSSDIDKSVLRTTTPFTIDELNMAINTLSNL